MRIIKEFKEFAVKGNMIDMAVGIIIGTAFNNVVQSLVHNIILPPLAFLTHGVSLENKKWVLKSAVTTTDQSIEIGYGDFVQTILNFAVIGWSIFMVIKLMNRLRNKSDDANDNTVVTPKDIELLNDLKELLSEQNAILKSNIK